MTTDLPRMKLPEENVPGLMVADLKQEVLKVALPVISKLPSILGLAL
jgi:hypothetical protein